MQQRYVSKYTDTTEIERFTKHLVLNSFYHLERIQKQKPTNTSTFFSIGGIKQHAYKISFTQQSHKWTQLKKSYFIDQSFLTLQSKMFIKPEAKNKAIKKYTLCVNLPITETAW